MRRSGWVETVGRCRYDALLSYKQIIEKTSKYEVQNMCCSMVIEVDGVYLLVVIICNPASEYMDSSIWRSLISVKLL